MEYKLYVGNLAYSVTDAELQTLFAQAGAVKSVAVIMDKMTGRSKGFAFVEMANEQDMQNAISMFNGKDFQSRALTVNVARPREERGGFGGGGGFNNRGGGNDRRRSKPKSGGNDRQRW
ncbi:MAG: RNA-binding protein [Anaerolineales bacterium]|jgi:RNA recognition motif-containing protein|uniref:RNA recognition motif domain-containing protein n=1 Tax=Candidatus Villigracilis vicinus TaxID=3140679 RepID=UPI003136F077|nr:RNA-binding protein [Anaerolineales bacterium]MBK7449900.1 RNA-binding protein [Anaerolineales bacterium]MBK9781397.1 RNA-binding protein [Anaerolineales bacterium]